MRLEFLDFEFAEAKKNTPLGSQSMNVTIDLVSASAEKTLLEVNFVYSVLYLPGDNLLRIGGKARFSDPNAKAAAEEWKKSRRITGMTGEQVVNAINYMASINAVFLAKMFNFLPPIVPPTIKFGEPAGTTAAPAAANAKGKR